MKLTNDEQVKIIKKLENKKHKRTSKWVNDKLIHLWSSEVFSVLKEQ